MKFSVIVLLYNSQFDKINLTLKSVVQQTLDDIEIIIADDGSEKNYYKEIEDYFKNIQFNNYKFTAKKENVGTVKNILDGLELAEGKYIRLIGAGDLLFNEKTLEVAYEYMEKNKSKVCFGRMKQYTIKDNSFIEGKPFIAPKDIIIYQKERTEKNRELIKRNILMFGDWISGASIFYEKVLLKSYLEVMKSSVKYCEDLITAKLVLDKVDIHFLDCFVTWYEVGEGITTSVSNNNALNRVLKDQDNFYDYLIERYEDPYLLKGKKILRYNNKGFLLKNRLKRLIMMPSRILFSVSINIQKRKGNNSDEKGYFNYKNWMDREGLKE